MSDVGPVVASHALGAVVGEWVPVVDGHIVTRSTFVASLGRALDLLGYDAGTAAEALDAAGRAVPSGRGVVLVTVARRDVGVTLAAPGGAPRIDVWRPAGAPVAPGAPPAPPLALVPAPWPRNHRARASRVLLVADGELLVTPPGSGTAEARLWYGLDGRLACAATGIVVVELDGRLVTPPVAAGVPDTGLRRLAVERLGVAEMPLTPADLGRATGAAVLTWWGDARPVGRIDDHPCDERAGRAPAIRLRRGLDDILS